MPQRPPTIGSPPRQHHEYDRARGSRQQRGYDRAWERCRDAYIKSHPICEQCLREGKTVVARDVDHIRPLRRGGARLDHDNLQSLCRRCHVCKTKGECARCRQGPQKPV